MPVTFTTRFGFPQWSADADPFVTRAQFDAFLSTLDAQAAQYAQNVASARPGFGVAGRFYEATDTGVLSYDTGAAWVTIGVLIDTVVADITTSHPGDAGAAGAIGKAADAGHRHPREAWGVVGDVAGSAPGDAAAVGASGHQADAGHKHGREGWGVVGDLQAPGTAAVGATGRVPDAGHVHPAPAAGLALIASNVLAAAVASVTFSSIPGTYHHLRLVAVARSAAAIGDFYTVQLNGDTAANYDLEGGNVNAPSSVSNTAASSWKSTAQDLTSAASASANSAGYLEIDLPAYAGTTFRKIGKWVSGVDDPGGIDAVFALVAWRSSAAVTSIKIATNTLNNFVVGSSFYLYGIN